MVEALGGAACPLVPRRRVAPVETDVRRSRRARNHRGDEVLRIRLWRVHHHVGQAAALEERERLRAVLLVEPAAVAELDQELVPGQLLLRPLDVLERDRLVDDVGRELEQDPAELARRSQGLERGGEAAEDLRAQLAWRPVDPAAIVDRHGLLQVLRDRVELDGVARHQPERLDVHRESLRRSLGPVRDQLLIREPVVRRVRLDDVEALGVVAQARLAGPDPSRVPDLRQRLVGPGTGADPYDRGHAAIVRVGESATSRSA